MLEHGLGAGGSALLVFHLAETCALARTFFAKLKPGSFVGLFYIEANASP